jgi:hypothetical protein
MNTLRSNKIVALALMAESSISTLYDDGQSQTQYSAMNRWIQTTPKGEYWNAVARLSEDESKDRRRVCKL